MCVVHGPADGVHGDGNRTRTPMHVRVVVAGLRAVVDSADLTGAINLAGTYEISAVELARRIVASPGAARSATSTSERRRPTESSPTARELLTSSAGRRRL